MKKRFKRNFGLSAVLTFYVFLVMLASVVLISGAALVFWHSGAGPRFYRGPNPLPLLIPLLVFSLVLGTVLAAVVGKRILTPLNRIIEATHRVAAGDFTAEIEDSRIPEIADLTDSFNAMVRELRGIETLRADFIANFSHEFKTPIVSIRGFAKLLKSPDLEEQDRAEYVDIIAQESERLAGLSASILELSKLENTGILTDRETFFLDEQIRRTAALLEPRCRRAGISLELDLDVVMIHASEELLQRVWVNLIDNAVKFTPEGGRIALSLRKEGDRAAVTVSDTGIGMDDETMAHIFDKFYQGDRSHAVAGSGLGLPMARRIVGLCGGEIAVRSAPGRGSAFTVTLPA